MSLASATASIVQRLLARSGSTQILKPASISLDDPQFQRARQNLGHISLRPEVKLQWLMHERDSAIEACTAGDLSGASLLAKIILSDPVFSGAINTRVSGTCSLPRKFRGRPDYVEALELGHDSVQSIFDSMVDPAQLRLILLDYLMLGVCVGTLEDVPGLKYPTLRRVDPQWLRYRWASGAGSTNWWYTTAVGAPINVRPGDGRWVLAENGIAASPWERGLFFPASQLYIQKFSCILESMNYENGLANPTILATSPQGATDLDRGDWSQAWSEIGPNRVISAPPGYDAKGLEIGKSGWESFQQSIKRCNEEMLVLCLGNTVSTLGNSGFSSASIYRDVKDVLVQDGARILEDIINKQILPQWVGRVYGWDKIEQSPCIEIDTHAPRDPTALAQAWTQAASALPQIETWLKSHEEELGLELDIQEVLVRYGIPTRSRQIRTAAERIGDGSWDVDITELDSGEESIDEIAEVA